MTTLIILDILLNKFCSKRIQAGILDKFYTYLFIYIWVGHFYFFLFTKSLPSIEWNVVRLVQQSNRPGVNVAKCKNTYKCFDIVSVKLKEKCMYVQQHLD